MFRSLLCKSGATLKRKLINGESSSSSSLLGPPAKYFLFRIQNQNVIVVPKSRVTSIFRYFSTTSDNSNSSDSNSYFVVSYLINSCGLSESEAIAASKKFNFKTTSNPDSVLVLLKSYGFTESHITKLVNKYPFILSSKPDKSLKPKFDFFISKGLSGPDLANFFSNYPTILMYSFDRVIIPSFDILKSIVHSDQNVITMIKRNHWTLNTNHVKRMMVNLELLRNQGVPQPNISNYLINQPRVYAQDADGFKEIVDKVKDMGFDPSKTTFLIAIHGLSSMSEACWRKKMDVYKRWGWSEDHIHTAFRKDPHCMTVSETKIMAIMNFLVNEMGHESLSVAENPRVFTCSLKERIIPRCSVIRILVSRGLIKEKMSISTISTMVDKYFVEKFVIKYEQQVPELMKVFQGQLNYQELIKN